MVGLASVVRIALGASILVLLPSGGTAAADTTPPAVVQALTPPPTVPTLNGAQEEALRSALGHVPSDATLGRIIDRQGVTLTVNGVRNSTASIASLAAGYLQGAVAHGADWAALERRSVPSALDVILKHPEVGLGQALAAETLFDLLYGHASATGQVAPVGMATSYAQYQYSLAKTHSGTAPAPTAGEYLSTGAIKTYQQLLTIEHQESLIAGAPSSNGVPRDRTPELAAWMAQALHHAKVTIHGVDHPTTAELPGDLAQGF